MTAVSPVSTHSYHWRSESRQTQQGGDQQYRSDSRASTIPDPVDRHVARWRSESRSSNKVFRNEEEPSQQDEIVNGTLTALKDDVEKTTEVIRRRGQQMRMERRQFQTEMEVTGRVSVSPTDEFLSTRLRAVSTEDMNRELGKIKEDQRQNAVTDTLAALVYDVNATAEVLRRGHGRGREGKKSVQKEALNMHGTFREHDRRPYCHDCFYRLYNGLLYKPDEHQKTIEKLI
ncbi:hypothetical protein TELCIR_06204 [Teladorsagia circumcincta]|uniref:Uncharacterized protein n=1 Tax=Teladorsagia circumcincta TaxID=45464 RepID=A0A2G9UQ81_TELCI|nr:hypothetical protein TELCIR_06204 [Teladorsagia circumcincta]